ncbi:restriction endonuclease [Mesorhizobium sp. M0019]|uniref:restriction endonuclease n=1 Tax=Mesorhizobium sp. M0019 TaxID=2956845 RepID=UPI003338864D
MTITTETPEQWRDLQQMVAAILREAGMNAEVEKTLPTVRSRIEIDIYSVETTDDGRRYSLVCECKNWKTAVPQEKVLALRSVMNDVGANKGYIISTGGFQSGAFDAAAATNISLVTWPEFQAEFEQLWFRKHFSPVITEKLDTLVGYVEPVGVPSWWHSLSEDGVVQFRKLLYKYALFGFLAQSLSSYALEFRKHDVPKLPLAEHAPGLLLRATGKKFEPVPNSVATATGYRQLMDEMLRVNDEALSAFHFVRDNFKKA